MSGIASLWYDCVSGPKSAPSTKAHWVEGTAVDVLFKVLSVGGVGASAVITALTITYVPACLTALFSNNPGRIAVAERLLERHPFSRQPLRRGGDDEVQQVRGAPAIGWRRRRRRR
jgi:hypothetical protein